MKYRKMVWIETKFKTFLNARAYASAWGQRITGISGSLIWSKTLMELIFKHWWILVKSRGPSYPNPFSLPPCLVPLGSFKVCSDVKERVGCRKQWEATALCIPSKTATLVPEFALEDLPLGRTAALVPEFAVKITLYIHHCCSQMLIPEGSLLN